MSDDTTPGGAGDDLLAEAEKTAKDAKDYGFGVYMAYSDTTLALIARVRAAEAERDRMATDLAVALADLDNSGATSLEIAAERDAALAQAAAAALAMRDAAVLFVRAEGEVWLRATPYPSHTEAKVTFKDLGRHLYSCAAAIAALPLPGDLAAAVERGASDV